MVAYTHAGANHLDDMLALLTARIEGYECRRVPKVPDDLGESDIVIDMGGQYDGERFFDHHHDGSLPCSAVLLWRAWGGRNVLYGKCLASRALQDLNDADTRVGIVGLPEARRPDRLRLRALLGAEGEILKDARYCTEVLLHFASASSLREFVDNCFNDDGVALQSVLQSSLARVIEAEREETALVEAVEVVQHEDILIGVSHKPLDRVVQRVFEERKVDVIIHPNTREAGKSSVVRDSTGRYGQVAVLDLLPQLKSRASFAHPAGFMAVVDGEPDAVLQVLLG